MMTETKKDFFAYADEMVERIVKLTEILDGLGPRDALDVLAHAGQLYALNTAPEKWMAEQFARDVGVEMAKRIKDTWGMFAAPPPRAKKAQSKKERKKP